MPSTQGTGKRCSFCFETIHQNQKTFRDAKGNVAHGDHIVDAKAWRQVK